LLIIQPNVSELLEAEYTVFYITTLDRFQKILSYFKWACAIKVQNIIWIPTTGPNTNVNLAAFGRVFTTHMQIFARTKLLVW